jgi:DNA-binding SARP family transcriptional activator
LEVAAANRFRRHVGRAVYSPTGAVNVTLRVNAPELHLLDGFQLVSGTREVELPMSAQRLLAFLAIHPRPLNRSYVAASLWLDTPEERAAANLRSALWRTRQSGKPLIRTLGVQLALATEVRVDLAEATTLARTLLEGREWSDGERPYLAMDLLPDWYDEWLDVEREQFRQLRLHALERLADDLTHRGEYGLALEAGLTAVAAEPLRETAQRVVIKAYLAEGNIGEAVRQYEWFRELCQHRLAVQPSPALARLVRARSETST